MYCFFFFFFAGIRVTVKVKVWVKVVGAAVPTRDFVNSKTQIIHGLCRQTVVNKPLILWDAGKSVSAVCHAAKRL